MISPTYTLETKLLNNHRFIAGVDEVGRAPLAGPVVAAVVILNPEKIGKYRSRTKWWHDVRDSKALSARQREGLADFIHQNALDFAIGEASHLEIDEMNIHNASLLAMRRAIEKLSLTPDIVLVDGLHAIPFLQFLPPPEADGGGKVRGIKQQAITQGDAKILSIAAASILAKVYRDSLMKKYALQFANYGFEKHKGYDTEFHRNQLFKFGPCAIHRLTFAPVSDAMNERFSRLVSSPLVGEDEGEG